jgi:hypothetical protein
LFYSLTVSFFLPLLFYSFFVLFFLCFILSFFHSFMLSLLLSFFPSFILTLFLFLYFHICLLSILTLLKYLFLLLRRFFGYWEYILISKICFQISTSHSLPKNVQKSRPPKKSFLHPKSSELIYQAIILMINPLSVHPGIQLFKI